MRLFGKSSQVVDFNKALNETKDYSKFLETVRKHIGTNSEFVIYERAGAAMPIVEIINLSTGIPQEIQSYVLNTYGDGIYIMQVRDSNGKTIISFETQLGNFNRIMAKRKAAYGNPNTLRNNGEEKPAALTSNVLVQTMMEMQRNQSSSLAESIKTVTELQQPFQQFLMQYAMNQGGGPDPLETFERMTSLFKNMQPHVEPQDPMTQILQMLMGFMPFFMGNKQIPQFNGLGQQVPQIPGQTLTPPGTPQDDKRQVQPVESSPAMLNFAESKSSVPPASNLSDQHKEFYNFYVQKFMSWIDENRNPKMLAQLLIDMIQYSATYMPDNPHPLMVDFVNAENQAQIAQAFNSFCAVIPQLSGNKKLQMEIGGSALTILDYMKSESPEIDLGEDSGETETDPGEAENEEVTING